MDNNKEILCKEIDSLTNELFGLSDYLLENPETAYQEFKACEHLSSVLERNGFIVEKGIGDVETSFLAKPENCQPRRPTVALLAEYDALPKIGHACGHNMIAAAGLGAAIALKRVLKEEAGGIAVVGTPAEEGGGGKALLAEAGVFKQMDAAMMFHPSSTTIAGKGMLGRIKFEVEFFGRTAHAAGTPDQGINALDALLQLFNSINALRQQVRADGRIHGIITHGGDAPNIIPDYTSALFYVRAGDREYRDDLFERVKKCCEGASLATGTTYKINVIPPVLDPMKRNPALESAAAENLRALGVNIDEDNGRKGSSDMGNLSHYLPSLHPWISIVDPDIAGHTVEFREATTSDRGRKTLIDAAKMLAMTAYDFLTRPELREQVASDFNK
jgi:amidohydrolase